MDDYLAKPVRHDDLTTAVRRVARQVGALDAGSINRPGPDEAAAAAEVMREVPPSPTEHRARLTEEPATPGAVDPAVLVALAERLGDRADGIRQELVRTCDDETTGRLAELDAALAADDRDGVSRVAHTLKSSSAALGALPLSVRSARRSRLGPAGPVSTGDLTADARALLREGGRRGRRRRASPPSGADPSLPRQLRAGVGRVGGGQSDSGRPWRRRTAGHRSFRARC